MKKLYTLCLLLALSFSVSAQIRYLKGNLTGNQEVPASGSAGTGVVIVKLNTVTNRIEVFGNYTGLGTPANASHIHQAAAGVNGGVILTINNTGGTNGTLSVNNTLTASQVTEMLAGNTYVNVHTTGIGTGEVRAQLTPTTDNKSIFLNARLQGAQEVPPNASTATGWANVLLDTGAHKVYVTGFYTGLGSNSTGAHLHSEGPGMIGSVLIPLVSQAGTSGTIHAESTIAPTDELDMIDGGVYANIHSVNFSGGEIRGQVNMFSQIWIIKGQLEGSQEVPPNASAGTGTALGAYYPDTKTLDIRGDFQNLGSNITAAHIHSPALPGSNAGVLFTLTGTPGLYGVVGGSEILTPAQEADLLGGKMYMNLHTTGFPGGEVRAQLSPYSFGDAQILIGVLEGTQEVPPVTTLAVGDVVVGLDRLTNQVYVSGTFNDLSSNATAAHIHTGAAGTNGTAVVTLSVVPNIEGVVTGTTTVSQAVANAMIAGNSYINIHTVNFPNGELRAQLGNFTLPVVLSYFNGYKEGKQVSLVWEVAQEENFSRYVVEQQNTGNGIWIEKQTILSKNATGKTAYKQQDIPVDYNNPYVYYRLKMIDKDGKYKYSPVVKINFKKNEAGLVILGNPVTNNDLKLVITNVTSPAKGNVSIIDVAGRILKKTVAIPGTNLSINIADLAPGSYMVLVYIDGKVLQQSFTK